MCSISPPPADHRRRPRAKHPIPRRAALAAAVQAAYRRRGGGVELLAAAAIVGLVVLHLPQHVEERVDVAAGQRERALRRVAVLALGVVEEAPEQRVVGALGAHHEALPLGPNVHREAPRRRRPAGAAAGAQPGLASLQGSWYQALPRDRLARRRRRHHRRRGAFFPLLYGHGHCRPRKTMS